MVFHGIVTSIIMLQSYLLGSHRQYYNVRSLCFVWTISFGKYNRFLMLTLICKLVAVAKIPVLSCVPCVLFGASPGQKKIDKP